MTTFRQIKRQARTTLHQRLSEQVIYRFDGQTSHKDVRLHLSFENVGELLRGGFAEMPEVTPTVIFLGFTPAKNAIVVTEDMGAWRVDVVMPPNDITVSAEVVKLTESQAVKEGLDLGLPWCGLDAP